MLELQYIEPELRENRGEIDAAEKGGLPAIVPYDADERRSPRPYNGKRREAFNPGDGGGGKGPRVRIYRHLRPFTEPADHPRADRSGDRRTDAGDRDT